MQITLGGGLKSDSNQISTDASKCGHLATLWCLLRLET